MHGQSARLKFQSTPPRGRRPLECALYVAPEGISIHSAARAETIKMEHLLMLAIISIHSAARAETDAARKCTYVVSISIHSAARAETKSHGHSFMVR